MNTLSTNDNIFKTRVPVKAVRCPVHDKINCYKYKQPDRMQPFKPNHKYQVPEEPFSTNTVYDLSYRPFGADTARGCRPELATLKGNIQTPCETLANDTVTSLSYVYNYQPPAEPFRPLHKPLPCAPLTQMTTNRHDFPPKPVSRTEPIKPHGNFSPICSKMDDQTITMASFMPLDPCSPPRSFKPVHKYEEPTVPLDGKTITQESFMCPGPPVREVPAWLPNRSFIPPDSPMEDNTIYNGSYQPPGFFEPCNCSPIQMAVGAGDVCLCGIETATEDL